MADLKKDNLLKVIVEEYISSVAPVGSGLVVEKYFPELSSATVRNYMVELEERGLIFQPHTSAGRIPTALGYQYYVENFTAEAKISQNNKKTLLALAKKLKADNEGIKYLAKELADMSGGAVLIGFGPMDVYYTGISQLFGQPEFFQQGLVYSMSEIIDHMDEIMATIFHKVGEDVDVLIGQNSPFGNMSSVVLTKYVLKDKEGLIGILGPNRMDYAQNMALVKYFQELIKNIEK